MGDFSTLLDGALARPVGPGFVLGQELVDVAEAEFERDKSSSVAEPLPEATAAPPGTLDILASPAEFDELLARLEGWHEPHPVADALLGGRYAQAAYRTQLLPLLGDLQAKTLKGATGSAARSEWRVQWGSALIDCIDPEVRALTEGFLALSSDGSGAPALLDIPPHTDTP